MAETLRDRACEWFCDQLEQEPAERQALLARQLYSRRQEAPWAVLSGVDGIAVGALPSAETIWQHAVQPRCEALWRDLQAEIPGRI